MAYGELFSLYDVYSWGSLVITGVLVALVWTLTTIQSLSNFGHPQVVNICTNIYYTLKVILEQENPVPDFTFKGDFSHKRVLLGILMLLGIVFSNGYKSSNVYKMVTPRNLIRFEELWQLIEDNVKIYVASIIAHNRKDGVGFGLNVLLASQEANVSISVVSGHKVEYLGYNKFGNEFKLSAVVVMTVINTT